jgi:hypothetical protein
MGIPPIKPTSVHQNGYPKMKIKAGSTRNLAGLK